MRTRYQNICNLIFLGLAFSSAQCAIADVIDGRVPIVSSNGSTITTIVAPANVSHFYGYQNSSVEVAGGHVSWLHMHDSSTASISGGNISWIKLYDNSSVRITGVDSLSWLVFEDTTSIAEIVATNVQYTNGLLSGNWDNGSPFIFWAVTSPIMPNDTIPSNIVISSVPEPSQGLLFLGGVAILAALRARRFS
jgi:hypothetical protein